MANQAEKDGQNNTNSNERSAYGTRKVRKKPAYHEDFAYGNETKNLKGKSKGFQKRVKTATKPVKGGSNSQVTIFIFIKAN